MIVITNGTEYIYLDEEHQIQKTTDISKAKTFTFQGCSIFIRENVKATKGFYAYDTETQRICYRRKKKKCFPKDHKNDDLQSSRRTLCVMWEKNQI